MHQSSQATDGRGLAGTVWADQAVELTRLYSEADPTHGFDITVIARELDGLESSHGTLLSNR
jgi:hypothetical protein